MSLWDVNYQDNVAVALFRNPPANYSNVAAFEELGELVSEWSSPDVRSVVLAGAPDAGAFITHFRVEDLLQSVRAGVADAGADTFPGPLHRIRASLLALEKPVITAMNGNTMGGGFEIALATDVRVGQRGDYRYGLPEVRMGIMPGGGGTQRLARLVGLATAVQIVLCGKIVDPDEALRLGLVSELADDALGRAIELATELASCPPAALAAAKRALYGGWDLPLGEALDLELECVRDTFRTGDAILGMSAYIDLPIEQRRSYLETGAYPLFSGH